MDLYVYRASIIEVTDGDTFVALCDQGFDEWHHTIFRLAGCAARETKDPGGPEAKANLAALLPTNSVVHMRSIKPNRPIPPDKYAPRWDALVYLLPDETDLVAKLIAEHWLAAWNGRGEQPKPPWPRPAEQL